MMEERKVIRLPSFPKVDELDEWVLVDYGEMKRLTEEEKDLEALLTSVRKRKAEIKQKIIEKLKESKTGQLKITDHAVAMKGKKWKVALKLETTKEACKAFRENGYENLVTETIFPQSLTEWAAQFEEDGELKLPDWAKEYVDVQCKEYVFLAMSGV